LANQHIDVISSYASADAGTAARTFVQAAAARRSATPAQTTSPASAAAAPVDAHAERRASKPETGQKCARRAAEDSFNDNARSLGNTELMSPSLHADKK